MKICAVITVAVIGLIGNFGEAIAQATDRPADTTKGAEVQVSCKAMNNACLEQVRTALAKTKYARQSSQIVSEVQKGYKAGEKSRLSKQPGYDYYFELKNPTGGAAAPKHHIHFTWAETIGLVIALFG